jgi:hypothetical protein
VNTFPMTFQKLLYIVYRAGQSSGQEWTKSYREYTCSESTKIHRILIISLHSVASTYFIKDMTFLCLHSRKTFVSTVFCIFYVHCRQRALLIQVIVCFIDGRSTLSHLDIQSTPPTQKSSYCFTLCV